MTTEKTHHWSEDPYWVDALDEYHQLRANGQTKIELDLEAIEEVLVNGDGPAYRLLDAMQSVVEHEGRMGTAALRGWSWRCWRSCRKYRRRVDDDGAAFHSRANVAIVGWG